MLFHGPDDTYGGREKVFLGTTVGLLLRQRGHEDCHIVFGYLIEDDEHWYITDQLCLSSYWLGELIAISQEALAWLERCAIRETYGYRFPA